MVSAVRLTGAPDITNYRPLFATMTLLGMAPYGLETPDGYPNTREAWLNPDAMMTRLSFSTAFGQGHLPLLAPPFEANGNGHGFHVKFKNGGGPGARMYELSGPGNGSPGNINAQMTPPEPTLLVASLGANLSANTREAIEAAPAQLRSALVLGSPEFMMR